MAKKIENKRKFLRSNTNVKAADKLKSDVQNQQNEKARLREEHSLKAQKNEELKILEHRVSICFISIYFIFI